MSKQAEKRAASTAAAASATAEQQEAVVRAEIAQLAYQHWVDKGRPEGTAEADWLEAEDELQSPAMRSAGLTREQIVT